MISLNQPSHRDLTKPNLTVPVVDQQVDRFARWLTAGCEKAAVCSDWQLFFHRLDWRLDVYQLPQSYWHRKIFLLEWFSELVVRKYVKG